jgi:aryl-alcohol dehydrogenase-like predicted oxidoreductase
MQNGWTRFISMQNSYSLLYREEEREMHAYCAYAGIGLIPWGPLAMGRLARPRGAASTARAKGYEATGWFSEFSAWEAELVDRVQKIASDRGWTMGQVALAWVGAKVTSPIVGFSSVRNVLDLRLSRPVLTCATRLSAWKKPLFRAKRSRTKK